MEASPVSRPCQNGELPDSASSIGRCARMRLYARTTARSGVGTRDVHVQRERRLAPRQLAHRASRGTGSARPARPRRPPRASNGCVPATAARDARAARARRRARCAAGAARRRRRATVGVRVGRELERRAVRLGARVRSMHVLGQRGEHLLRARGRGSTSSGSSSITSSSTPTVHGASRPARCQSAQCPALASCRAHLPGSGALQASASATSSRNSAQCSGQLDERLGVPLHAQERARRRRSRCPRRGRPAPTRPRAARWPSAVDRLVVERVDVGLGHAHDSREPRVRARSARGGSATRPRSRLAVLDRGADDVGRCWCSVPPRATLSVCAPRQIAEHRHPARVGELRERELVGVEVGSVGAELRVARLLAVAVRVDVRAAREADARRAGRAAARSCRGRAAGARPAAPPASSIARM